MFMLTAMLRGAVFAMKAGAGEPTVSDIWAVGCGVEQLCDSSAVCLCCTLVVVCPTRRCKIYLQ